MVDRILGYAERRWGRIILVAAIIGGVVGFAAERNQPDLYVARSLVVLTEANIPPENFADVARAMFPTDAVLLPVIRDLGLDQTPAQLISSGTLAIDPQPGGLAVEVIARTRGPDLAVTLANAVTARIADESQVNGIGSLAEFRAEGPATRQVASPLKGIATGALIGALLAALNVAILVSLRRWTLGGDGQLRFDSMVRVRVRREDGEEGEDLIVERPPHLSTLLSASEANPQGEIAALIVDDGRDLWACLAVAADMERFSKETAEVPPIRSVAPGGAIGEDPSALIVIAAEHTPSSRLRTLGRRLNEQATGVPTTLLLVEPSGPA